MQTKVPFKLFVFVEALLMKWKMRFLLEINLMYSTQKQTYVAENIIEFTFYYKF